MAVALLQLVDGLQRALRGRARAEDRAARLTAYVEELGAAERLSGPRRPSAAFPTTNPCPSPDSAAIQSTMHE